MSKILWYIDEMNSKTWNVYMDSWLWYSCIWIWICLNDVVIRNLYMFFQCASRILKWIYHVCSRMSFCACFQMVYLHISIYLVHVVCTNPYFFYFYNDVASGHWIASIPISRKTWIVPKLLVIPQVWGWSLLF